MLRKYELSPREQVAVEASWLARALQLLDQQVKFSEEHLFVSQDEAETFLHHHPDISSVIEYVYGEKGRPIRTALQALVKVGFALQVDEEEDLVVGGKLINSTYLDEVFLETGTQRLSPLHTEYGDLEEVLAQPREQQPLLAALIEWADLWYVLLVPQHFGRVEQQQVFEPSLYGQFQEKVLDLEFQNPAITKGEIWERLSAFRDANRDVWAAFLETVSRAKIAVAYLGGNPGNFRPTPEVLDEISSTQLDKYRASRKIHRDRWELLLVQELLRQEGIKFEGPQAEAVGIDITEWLNNRTEVSPEV